MNISIINYFSQVETLFSSRSSPGFVPVWTTSKLLQTLQKLSVLFLSWAHFTTPSDPLFCKFKILKLTECNRLHSACIMYNVVHKFYTVISSEWPPLLMNTTRGRPTWVFLRLMPIWTASISDFEKYLVYNSVYDASKVQNVLALNCDSRFNVQSLCIRDTGLIYSGHLGLLQRVLKTKSANLKKIKIKSKSLALMVLKL